MCFQDTGDVEIRPLTFLVGPNSSGKSSLMHLLLMLRQTVESIERPNAIVANGGWIRCGAYPEYVFNRETDREIEFTVQFSQRRDKSLTGVLELRATLGYDPKTTEVRIQSMLVHHDLERVPDTRETSKKLTKHSFRQKISYSKKTNLYNLSAKIATDVFRANNVRPIKFYSYDLPLPKTLPNKFTTRHIARLTTVQQLARIVELNFQRIDYLGPLREPPKPVYISSGRSPQSVGIRGENAIDALWYSKRLGKTKHSNDLLKTTRGWIRKFGFGQNIRLIRDKTATSFHVQIKDQYLGTELNISNMGFGASQTLPIIIQCFYAPPDSTLIIEQPEIHLHPAAQATLGDLFIDAARNAGTNFVIETHSEHLLARIRRRIAESKLDWKDVAIYYFDPTTEGTKISPIKINEHGQLEDFPTGFFEEGLNEAFAHLKAIKPKSKRRRVPKVRK